MENLMAFLPMILMIALLYFLMIRPQQKKQKAQKPAEKPQKQEKAQKLCEKLGMRREGLFCEFVTFVNDEKGDPIYENTYQYAILKKEWEQGKK